jgi:hypothetical protein
MDAEKFRDKFEEAREKLGDVTGKLDRENGNYLVAGTASLVILIAVVGVSTDFQAVDRETAVFGEVTQINYSTSHLSEDTVSNIAEAMNESGWEGSSSTVRQLNSSWYRVNLSTSVPPNERLTIDEQYQIQTTMTIMHHRAFNETDNVILNIEAGDGSILSQFVQ